MHPCPRHPPAASHPITHLLGRHIQRDVKQQALLGPGKLH